MGAPKGNKFWELRSKHGRDAIFTDPEKLKEAAFDYFTKTSERKLKEKDWVGKDAFEVEREHTPPFTLTGLCIFLDVNTAYWRHFKESKTVKEDEDFSTVITRIENIIYTQKFEGAATGFYNSSIIAKDLGLADKQELKHSGSIQSVNLTKEEAKQISDALDDKV